AQSARVGDTIGRASAEGGVQVLTYTDITKLVTVELQVADLPLAVKGRRGTGTVAGRRPGKGTIAQVGTVATAPSATTAEGTTPTSSGSTPDATGEGTGTNADPRAPGSPDAAPRDVGFI